jgi:hypothetical protein
MASTLFSCVKNNSGGEQESIPIVTTTAVSALTGSGANSGGNISSDGGSAVTARGVCWSTISNPTTDDSHTTDGNGKGAFTSSITGLSQYTKYYLRSYATNVKGTAYGNEISFTTAGPSVYVAGGDSVKAFLWINGVKTPLTDGSSTSLAKSVFVSGNDVYVGGDHGGYPRIWKNGVATTVQASNYGEVRSIFVAGTDIYAGGTDDMATVGKPKVWKNSVALNTETGQYGGWISSVFVSGGDVYAGGAHYRTQYINTPALWKNGVLTRLSDNQGSVNAIWASGSDVYAVGYEYSGGGMLARVWKNGVGSSLTSNGSANSLFISGNDIYIGGYESNGIKAIPKIWKNGVPTILANNDKGASVNSIYVLGGDVYATGTESNGSLDVLVMWKNGVSTSLTNGTFVNARSFSIFVK